MRRRGYSRGPWFTKNDCAAKDEVPTKSVLDEKLEDIDEAHKYNEVLTIDRVNPKPVIV